MLSKICATVLSRQHAISSLYTVVMVAVGCFLVLSCSQKPNQPNEESISLNDFGVAQMGQYHYRAAFETFSRVVEDNPGWELATVNLAISILNRQDSGDEHLAIETLSQVLERNPNNVRAQYTTGIIQLYLGEANTAITHLNQAFNLDSTDAYTTYFLGQANLQTENYREARDWFLKTLELNPALRSAYWAAATASRRIDEVERSLELIEQYKRFEHNPMSVTAGFSYKQMGPKAEAQSVVTNSYQRLPLPAGDLFAEPQVLFDDPSVTSVRSITSADSNANGLWSVFLDMGDFNLMFKTEENSVTPLSRSSKQRDLNGTLSWADLNNDGNLDVVICNADGVYWLGLDSGDKDESQLFPAPGHISDLQCRNTRVVDSDHDGDLDIFVLTGDGISLVQNNTDNDYKNVGLGIDLEGDTVQQVLILDADVDRDADVLLIGENTNVLWLNDLTWQYVRADIPMELSSQKILAGTFADLDVDGYPDLVIGAPNGIVETWSLIAGEWGHTTLATFDSRTILELDTKDFDGDGLMDVLVVLDDGFEVVSPSRGASIASHSRENMKGAVPYYISADKGLGLVTASSKGLELWPPGNGRADFMALVPTGKSSADQMRSNASGIGTHLKLRTQSRWSIVSTYPSHSGLGQSLIPVTFGSAGNTTAEYLDILWPDGVSQSEIGLEFGKLHTVEEVQRQLASCPVVFAWNGHKYEFVTDVLGVAALGLYVEPGTTAPVRAFELLQFKTGALQPRDGYFEVIIGEPMEEILYLDAAWLLAFDVPEDLEMVMDERLNVQSAQPTGDPILFRKTYEPIAAYSADGTEITDLLKTVDLKAPSPGKVHPSFIGLVESEHTITLEFDSVLSESSMVLVADGWMEYPYSQTVHAANQAEVSYIAPTLEARDLNGEWQVVAEQFGYPAGMPRTMALPIENLPEGSNALRISSNMEIYWDRIRLVKSESWDGLEVVPVKPFDAHVKTSSFALRTTGPQRTPHYDYDLRKPYWDAKHAEGNYTITGEVTPLVVEADSALAIIGSGEEVRLRFKEPDAARPGYSRHYVLDVRGWAKDMDLYTKFGDQVEPIPSLPDLSLSQLRKRDQLHDKYNVRFQSGVSP